MKISVIIPTIGRETLSAVLGELLNNKCVQSLEVLVVGDNVEVEGPFEDARLKILKTNSKVGASGARNLGIEKSTGDILVFIGDDTIPDKNFLEKIEDWHTKNPDIKKVLLGQIPWTENCMKDPFHQWLLLGPQFDFKSLNKGMKPSWKHFYTSNVSVKKELVGTDLFSEKFKGWGFEDIEFGYRLAQKDMEITYDPDLMVRHDHPQNIETLCQQTRQAQANAEVFETLHPELKIQPQGMRKMILKCCIWGLKPLAFIPCVKWWRLWKQAWLG